MRQVRTHAFAMPDCGVWLWPHELRALVGLPAWHLALFVHLVARSTFKTGQGVTCWGELVNALTPDQPARGPRLWAPSTREVRDAAAGLHRLCIAVFDSRRGVEEQAVFFEVAPRTGRGVSDGKLRRDLRRGSNEEKTAETPQGSPTGLSAGNSNNARDPVDKSPVDNVDPEVMARMKLLQSKLAGSSGGIKRAPKGARTSAAEAATPPRAAPSVSP